MNITELKAKLIVKIEQIEDVQLLRTLYSILTEERKEEVYPLSESQNSAIEEAREHYRTGESFAKEEVDHDTLEWLKKEIELGWDGPDSSMTMDQIIDSLKKL